MTPALVLPRSDGDDEIRGLHIAEGRAGKVITVIVSMFAACIVFSFLSVLTFLCPCCEHDPRPYARLIGICGQLIDMLRSEPGARCRTLRGVSGIFLLPVVV
jgi:hypothetical protein